MYFPAPPPAGPARRAGPSRHGAELELADAAAWPDPAGHHRHRDHPVRHRRRHGLGPAAPAADQPAAPGRTTRASCPSSRAPSSGSRRSPARLTATRSRVWLWSSRPDADPAEVDRCWQAFLRRFDIEHTFRFLKQVLGWTRPKLRDPAAADRWTWLIIACLRPAAGSPATSPPTCGCPGSGPARPAGSPPPASAAGSGTSARHLPVLASAPKPGKPGPGRPPGSKNRRPATRHDVGKTARQPETANAAAG